jgi:hypothetical protein
MKAPLTSEQVVELVARIDAAHELLIGIARDLRFANDFDHAQDMSDAALFCRAARNDLRLGENTRSKPIRRRNDT